jgi:hypothetical protein
MTHRVFSRNASSSRAIPINTFLKQVWNDPAGPIHWGANNVGMQSKKELTGIKKWIAKKTWNLTGKLVCGIVWVVNKICKPHKQTFNRLLEPWQYISVIITATEWDNFLELRDHHDAQPEIRELACAIKSALYYSTPVERYAHLPYVTECERNEFPLPTCMSISSARCARVSYLTHEGNIPTIEKDLKLYNSLVGSNPIHASPTEHPAISMGESKFYKNFRDWKQWRYEVEALSFVRKLQNK